MRDFKLRHRQSPLGAGDSLVAQTVYETYGLARIFHPISVEAL
jgi:hypothetical protein